MYAVQIHEDSRSTRGLASYSRAGSQRLLPCTVTRTAVTVRSTAEPLTISFLCRIACGDAARGAHNLPQTANAGTVHEGRSHTIAHSNARAKKTGRISRPLRIAYGRGSFRIADFECAKKSKFCGCL
jgi:hypothetical protein